MPKRSHADVADRSAGRTARSLAGLILVALIMVAATCVQTGDDYYRDVHYIHKAFVADVAALTESAAFHGEECETDPYSESCHRVVQDFIETGEVFARTRARVIDLTPPPEAAIWHSDYLAFLTDGIHWAPRAAIAYEFGDVPTYLSEMKVWDQLLDRDEVLGQRFVQIQKNTR